MKTLDIEKLVLKEGAHADASSGMCVMEAVSFVAGEKFSDHPQCACPILGTFMRSWNDSLDEATRQKLKLYIPRLVGTNDGNSERRGWMFLDWLSRECTPAFLELAGLEAEARSLRELQEITDHEVLKAAQPKLAQASKATAAAWDAAWDAAWAAALDAAFPWAAARAAAWDAARAAAWDAAGAAAWAAALDAAFPWAAARAAAGAAARDAARAAAGEKLAPVVTRLQDSAFALLDKMLTLPKAA